MYHNIVAGECRVTSTCMSLSYKRPCLQVICLAVNSCNQRNASHTFATEDRMSSVLYHILIISYHIYHILIISRGCVDYASIILSIIGRHKH